MEVVGPQNIITSEDEVTPFNVDFTKKYVGASKLVITPASTCQISEILEYCN